MIDIKTIREYTKDLNILYIEDDFEISEATQTLFVNYFNSVDIAADGQEGLEKYIYYQEDREFFYDLVITDINMPHLNGLDMSREILDKNPIQSIILITAHNEISYLKDAIDLGVDGFINKPIQLKQFNNIIYKISQAISDHKFVESHVDLIEDLNIKLEGQNRDLVNKNAELEKSLRLLDTVINKEDMLNLKKESSEVNTDDKSSFYNEHKEQLEELISNDLAELEDIITEVDNSIIEIISGEGAVSTKELSALSNLFIRYSAILHFYSFFDELGQSMFQFAETIRDNPLPENEESVKNVFMLLESFIYVLCKWQTDISSGDDSKINQFDASIISDMRTITNMWTLKEEEACEEELDGIFDF